MGDNSPDFRPKPQQSNGTGLHVLHYPKHNGTTTPKSPNKEMESKLLAWLFYLLTSTGYGYIVLLNIENVKGILLLILAGLYGIGHVVLLVFRIIQKNQDRRMRELDIIERERSLYDGDTI